ncbi:LysM peptidoglycan-binding domain-containing protein [Pseudorhodobacter sp.]|uniref:LysM peptidoglycan-binding domain-containing protein n=1 Tax=Pseudorhodobacter sp. TaxID=1934400 RepID=UPI0026498FED|nr:LysM peptidoglycan-binding domain-containing protein [Pseudorhodobacter sp.]MDN5786253.1 peptidoglycan DD-metalloendopeptidase family protein [Pseudorhodobacter sp.]
MTRFPRLLMIGVAFGALGACSQDGFDWDLRGLTGGALDTSDAARQVTENRPAADNRGVIAYPGYQVALARRGDTVTSVAARVGISADELGRYNALKPNDLLREGELLALPRRVAAAPVIGTAPQSGAIVGGTIAPAPVEVTAIASGALDRVGGSTAQPAPATTREQPGRHRVKRGETIYSVARTYGVSVKSLADWNGLGPDLDLREGQYLLIPVVAAAAPTRPSNSTNAPGTQSPIATPPSASQPLPAEKTQPAAEKPKNMPGSPDLGKTRTAASESKYVMPAEGRIIRPFTKGKSEGIDIGAAAGSVVKATAAGEVAAITKDTDQVPIIVLRHPGNILSVYAGIDAVKVKKGDQVSKGQAIAVVRKANPTFLHFEVRKGVEAVDPVSLLQ